MHAITAAFALMTASVFPSPQSPDPRSPTVKAVVVSISTNPPSCPRLALSDRLRFGDAAAWIADPYTFWFVVDADGRRLSSLQQLATRDHRSLHLWSDRNRNGVPDGAEIRPFFDVIAGVDTLIMPVAGSYVCRARVAVQIRPGHYPGVSPARPATQTAWEIEMPADAAMAEYRYGATPVRGVVASVTRSGDGYVFQITNKRSSAIEALSIHVDEGRGGQGYSSDMYRTERRQSPQGETGRIMPGETRDIKLGRARPNASGSKAVVRAVLFEDMHFEGDHAQRTEWFEERDAYAAQLTDWLPVLRAAAQTTDVTLGRKILHEKLAERRSPIATGTSSSVDGIIEQVLSRIVSNEAPISGMLDFLIPYFEGELAKATRHRAEMSK